MAHKQLKLVRGTAAEIAAYTLEDGEIVLNSDDGGLVWGDGSTLGGKWRFLPSMKPPEGRLSLTSGVSVMTADVTGTSLIYYVPHIGDHIPIYGGSSVGWTIYPFTAPGIQLDSNSGHAGYHQSGKLFDLYSYFNGAVHIGSSPAWVSDTSRGTGAGTTELQKLNGIWTNKNSITLRFGTSSGNTISIAANQATYVGTLYATADGQTGMAMGPNSGAGGAGNILGLYNAYNRVRVISASADSTSSWTYNSATFQAANANNNNRISFVDGLGTSSIEATYSVTGQTASGGNRAFNAIGLDRTNNYDASVGASSSTAGANNTIISIFASRPLLGLHFLQAVEASAGSGTVTFYGGISTLLRASLEM